MPTKAPQEVERTYLFRASDIFIPQTQQDLKADPAAGLKRKIIATSEGVWNGDLFSAEEIQKSVQDAIQLKDSEQLQYFAIPLILDHGYEFLDKVGTTFDLTFEKEVKIRNKTVLNAAVASVEFWTGTPMLDEVAARVLKDPEGTYFSVRIRGLLNYDQNKDQTYWTDFRITHIAPVLEPADPDAQMIGELAKKTPVSRAADFSLSAVTPDAPLMAPPTVEDLQREIATLKERNADLEAKYKQTQTADAQKAELAAAADLEAKALLLAEVFALDKDVDKNFVKTLNKDQLTAYKADLERRVNTGTSEKGKSSGGSGGGQPSSEDYAKQLLGLHEKRV